MRVLFIGLLAILHAFPCNSMARADEDSLLCMLRDVVNTKYEKFRNDSLPANFVGVRVDDRKYTKLKSVLGVSDNKEDTHERVYGINIKIGSSRSLNYQYRFVPPFEGVEFTNVDDKLQASVSEELEKRFSWLKEGRKGFGKDTLGHVISLNEVGYYSGPLPGKYYEEPLANDGFDADKWQALLNEVTNKFRTENHLLDISASLERQIVRKYLVTSDGGEIVTNEQRYALYLTVKILRSNGEPNTLNTKIKRKKRKQKQPIILIHRYL